MIGMIGTYSIWHQILTIVAFAAGISATVLLVYWIASIVNSFFKGIKPPARDNLIDVPKPNVTYNQRDGHKAKKPVS